MDTIALAAFDADDLAVVSAHMQDAILRVSDLTYLPREKRFALVANRFAWEAAGETDRFQRRQTGLHVDRALNVRTRGIDRAAGETVLNLLAITFEPGAEAPAGAVVFLFAAGKEIRIDVECLELAMRDLGPAWSTATRPQHGGDA